MKKGKVTPKEFADKQNTEAFEVFLSLIFAPFWKNLREKTWAFFNFLGKPF